MVKVSELLINIVIMNGLKLLTSLTQNLGTKQRYSPVSMGIHGSGRFRWKGRT